jgi:YVTN family beta-propeller protein
MTNLPQGAVTFLFTDIEGSTRLVKQLRDEYPAVLHQHQALLRAAFEAHRGHEIDTQGDSFFVAFASARDALLAAVAGQRALLSHPWPEGVQIRVRMGLHTGQAVASGDRYTGLAVHRAARIGAAGHGGQILVSQATQTLLEDEEEDLRVHLRDLGEQQLKDLDRPVRLYEAAAEGLPTAFPPLRHEATPPASTTQRASRRRAGVLAAALAALGVIVVGIVLLTRESGGGLSVVQPNHVGVIDPTSNDIVGEVPVGLRPGPLAAGEGAVWVGNLDDRNLTKIAVPERSNAGTVSLENRTPTGIATGEGAVWVAHGRLGTVSRVDPQFTRVTDTIPVIGFPTALVGGAVTVGSGSVWATFSDSTLARIDPVGLEVTGRALAGSQPLSIAHGAGAIWVANALDANVERFNPLTFEEGPVDEPSVGARPLAVVVGAGAVWVANSSDDTVTRIGITSLATRTIDVGDGPSAVAYGSGGVWVANTDGRSVTRIDPATGDVTATIPVGNAPAGLAIAGDLVWVSVQAP